MRLPNGPRRKRNADIYRRFSNGETQTALAKEYGLARQTIWLICHEEASYELPPIDDRKTYRQALAAAYAERLSTAHELDTDAFVKLAKGLRELGGLDFRHDLEERLVKIDETKLAMLREAICYAMVEAALTGQQRSEFGEALDNRLAELEATG